MKIACQSFGQLPDGRRVDIYTLSNDNGCTVRVMTYGCTVVSIHAADRDGVFEDIVLGFDSLDGYLSPHPYFGATIGRYANRITHGRYTLDGVAYQLACNDGPNHLHGGIAGFDKRLWTAHMGSERGRPCLEMQYTSAHGEEGYPGTLETRVTYALNQANELAITYQAQCDRRTIVNLTNHAYFNLGGRGDVLDHVFQLPARYFLPVGETLIPTGEILPVHGTWMDFTAPSALRGRVSRNDRQLAIAGGYDHTWVLPYRDQTPRVAARVHEPLSGRMLVVATTQPGVQFYSGNKLDGRIAGKGRCRYLRHAGFCLEPHRFPDSPNRPSFPSAILEPGAIYRERSIYRFGVTGPPARHAA